MNEKEKIDLSTFYKLPKNLFEKWCNNEISTTAFKILILFIDTYKISKINKKNYFSLSYNTLQKKLDLKYRNSISSAIKELENLGYLKIEKNIKGKASKYRLNIKE